MLPSVIGGPWGSEGRRVASLDTALRTDLAVNIKVGLWAPNDELMARTYPPCQPV